MTSSQRVACAFARRRPDRIPFGDFCIDNRCAAGILGRATPIHNPVMWLDRLADGDWDGLVEQEAADWVDLARGAGLDWVSVDANWPRPAERPRKLGAHAWEWRGAAYTFDPATWLMQTSRPGGSAVAVEEEARRILASPDAPPAPPHGEAFAVARGVVRRVAEAERAAGGLEAMPSVEC